MRCLAATRNQTFGLETLLNLICGIAIDHLALAPSGAPLPYALWRYANRHNFRIVGALAYCAIWRYAN
jgi:hypothetical protein